MKRYAAILFGLAGCLASLGCTSREKEEERARQADFEKMVIIQDQDAGSTIGGESEQELKMR